MQAAPFLEEYGPALLAVGGTAAQIKANNDAAEKKREILNQQLSRTQQTTDKALQTIQTEGQAFTPQSRMQALASAEAQNYGQTQADLGAGGSFIGEAAPGGAINVDYVRTRAARAVEEGNRMTAIAREAARARAPGNVGMDDRMRLASTQGDLASMYGTNRNMANAAGVDAESVQPGALGNFGKVASALGQGMATRGMRQTGINFGGR